jgi:hypothetical protein
MVYSKFTKEMGNSTSNLGEEDRVSAYFSNDICKCDEVGNG